MKIIVLTYRAFGKESTVRLRFLDGFQNHAVQAVNLVFKNRQWRNINNELIYRLRRLKMLSGELGGRGKHRAENLGKVLNRALRKAQIKRPVMWCGLRCSYATYWLESGNDLRYRQDLLECKTMS